MDIERFKSLEEKLDDSIRVQLINLRNYLSQNKASVLVGAGFSKNAQMSEDVVVKDWPGLSRDFYLSLHGQEPEDKDLALKSPLRLAQQIDSSYGRNALDEIIKAAIPDKSINPGYLHELLVSLNWRDIFTTNYDTLLERAAVNKYKQYFTVTSKNSLIYQNHPRIVKLHGSFSDSGRLIITEEDYRTYSERYPEFVNTIRQALIETKFLLIGFSGDDPNFLNWLGWIRDIMGKEMGPIYMVYVGPKMPLTELRLLNYLHIEPINTSDITISPAEAIDFILSFIGDVHNTELTWNGKLSSHFPSDEDLVKLTHEMKKIRETCPKWIILPHKHMKEDFDDCFKELAFYGTDYKELTNLQKLEFLYELVWRINMSCVPFWFETFWLPKALKFFSDRENIQSLIKELKIENDSERINEIWGKAEYITILWIKLLRITDGKEFESELQALKQRSFINESYCRRALHYEESIYNLSHCRNRELKTLLDEWDVKPDDYQGSLWKSKILMEMGKFDKAGILLEEAIGNVRRKLLTNSKDIRRKSALAVLTKCQSIARYEFRNTGNKDEEFKLKDYLDWFTAEMRITERFGTLYTHGFNIGNAGRQWVSGSRGFFERFVGAGRYFMFAEAFGLPVGSPRMGFNNDIALKALPLLSTVCLEASIFYLIECHLEKGVDLTVTREVIVGLNKNQATAIFDELIKILSPYIEKKENITDKEKELTIILPIAARLCVWLDDERIEKLTDFIISIFNPNFSEQLQALRTCLNSMSREKQIDYFWKIMNLPIQSNLYSRDYPLPGVKIDTWGGTSETIEHIINGFESDDHNIRRIAAYRYARIHKLLPAEYKKKTDRVIQERFEELKNTRLISVIGHECDSTAPTDWYSSLKGYVLTTLSNLTDLDYKFTGSSDIISKFEKEIAILINCKKLLNTDLQLAVVADIHRFVTTNFDDILSSHDREEMLGGMHQCWIKVLDKCSYFIMDTDLSAMRNEDRNDLFQLFEKLSGEYPVMKGLVNLALLNKDKIIDENRKELIKSKLMTKIVSKYNEILEDAFEATMKLKSKDSQEIISKAIDRCQYFFDTTALNILICLPMWVRKDVIEKKELKKLLKVLELLPSNIKGLSELDATLKMDILYYAGSLVKAIHTKGVSEDIQQQLNSCYLVWKELKENDVYPRDVLALF